MYAACIQFVRLGEELALLCESGEWDVALCLVKHGVTFLLISQYEYEGRMNCVDVDEHEPLIFAAICDKKEILTASPDLREELFNTINASVLSPYCLLVHVLYDSTSEILISMHAVPICAFNPLRSLPPSKSLDWLHRIYCA
jgi:hypothetical protein